MMSRVRNVSPRSRTSRSSRSLSIRWRQHRKMRRTGLAHPWRNAPVCRGPLSGGSGVAIQPELWRCGCGREPWSGGEELGEGVKLVDSPLASGGQVGLDDREVGESVEGSPASAGCAHLHLDGAYVAFGLVAGEPDGQVGGEPQDHVLVVAEPAGQPQPVFG